ncbi:MAG: ArnT family glycosyltransferase [Candidatus Brocadiia bacterium]
MDSAATEGTASARRGAAAGRRVATAMLWALVVVAATVALRIPSFRLPLDQDGAVFCYVARTWAEGGLPYRDAWDHKLPLIYLVYRGLFAVGSSAPGAVNATLRAGAAACDALTALVVLAVGWRLFGRGAGVAAALAFTVFAGLPVMQSEALQPERPMVLFTAGAVLAAVGYARSRRLWQAGLCGLLFGLALATKQVAAPVGVAVWAWLTWAVLRDEGRAGLRRAAAHSALLLVGAVVPFAAVAGYFALRGAFEDFWTCTYTFNVFYAREHRKGMLVEGLRQMVGAKLYDHAFLWAAGAGGLAVALVRRRSRRAGALAALWVGATFLGLFLPGQFAHYYYLPTLPPLALASGVGLAALWGFARGPAPRALRVGLGGGCALVLVGLLAFAVKRGYGPGGHYAQITSPRATDVVVARVAKWLRAHTEEGDRLYMWGGRPQIYVLSGRRNACRYLYNFYYGLPKEQAYHYQEAKLAEIIAALEEHQPPYIVVTDPETFAYFPALKAHLDEHYTYVETWQAEAYPPRVYERVERPSS